MLTVRRRAIEIAADPANFEIGAPSLEFENPSDAKLEADAHIAICIDGIAGKLVPSMAHRSKFMEIFTTSLDEVFGEEKPKTKKEAEMASSVYASTFNAVYVKDDFVRGVFDTPFGNKAAEASMNYVNSCKELFKKRGIKPQHDRIDAYKDPAELVTNGLRTINNVCSDLAFELTMHEIDADFVPNLLDDLTNEIRSLASMTLAQLPRVFVACPVEGKSNTLSFSSAIAEGRLKRKHESDWLAQIYGDSKCAAMPTLPKTDRLHGGSALAKFYRLGVELILATDLHAVDLDDPNHRILRGSTSASS